MPRTSPLLVAVGATLCGLGVVVALLAVAFQPLLLFLAAVLGAAGYLIWLHGAGRLTVRTPPGGLGERVRAGIGDERGRRTTADPTAEGGRERFDPDAGREQFDPGAARAGWTRERWREREKSDGAAFRDGGGHRSRRTAAGRRARATGRRARGARRTRGTGPGSTAGGSVRQPTSGPDHEEARRILGVDADSGTEEVRRAYRRRVKETHPDADGGNREAFKRVRAAYETLNDGD